MGRPRRFIHPPSGCRGSAPCHSPARSRATRRDAAVAGRRGSARDDVEDLRSAVQRTAAGRTAAPRGRAGIASSGTYGGFDNDRHRAVGEHRGEGLLDVDVVHAGVVRAAVGEVLQGPHEGVDRVLRRVRARACGTSVASARAIAPLPVPSPTAIGRADAAALASASIANCATISVSGRAERTTRGPTRLAPRGAGTGRSR